MCTSSYMINITFYTLLLHLVYDSIPDESGDSDEMMEHG